MTIKTPTFLQRFYKYAYTRTWAWLLVRYLVVPALCAYLIVREHVPELVADMRESWAELEDERKAELSGGQEVSQEGR